MTSSSPPPSPPPPRWRRYLPYALAVLFALLAGVTIIVDNDSGGPPGTPHHTTVTITTKNGVKITAPIAGVQDAAGPKAEEGLGHDNATPSQLRQDDRAASPLAPRYVGPPPAAAPTQPGCTTATISHNYSFRNGVRPSLIVPHLTVSANVFNSSADARSIVAFFDRPATQASSNYVIDGDGFCYLMVAETLKAWAQANYNGATACSIEVVNTGNEPVYARAAGLNKIARVVHDCAHRWDIPLQRGSVAGGAVKRAGVIDHYHLGAAGGGHFDVHNFGAGCVNQGASADTWKCVDLIISEARALDKPVKPVSAKARRACQRLNRLRKVKNYGTEATGLKRLLDRHGYRCGYGPPGKIARK